MLRASGQHDGSDYDLSVMTRAGAAGGGDERDQTGAADFAPSCRDSRWRIWDPVIIHDTNQIRGLLVEDELVGSGVDSWSGIGHVKRQQRSVNLATR